MKSVFVENVITPFHPVLGIWVEPQLRVLIAIALNSTINTGVEVGK